MLCVGVLDIFRMLKIAHTGTIVIYELVSEKYNQSMPVTNTHRFLVSVKTGSKLY
jgi:hypothetical protein